jgi:hypothetical protein
MNSLLGCNALHFYFVQQEKKIRQFLFDVNELLKLSTST